MINFFKYFVVLFFLIVTIPCNGQEIDTMRIKHEATKLLQTGGDLYREGLYSQALDTFKLFLDHRKIIYGEQDYNLASAYLNIGITYKNMGQYDLALENCEKAEQNYLLKEDLNSIYITRLYRNIGNIYRAKLDYKNALNYFEQALSIQLEQETVDLMATSDAYYAIAEINYLMENFNIAIDLLKKNINNGDAYTKIYYNELLAIIYRHLGNDDLALSYYQQMLKLANNELEHSDIELGIIYLNYAEFLFTLGSVDLSLEILEVAFNIIKTSQPLRGEQLSRYYELRGGIFQDKSIETKEINRFKEQKRSNLNNAIFWYTIGLNALSSSKNEIDINSLRIEHCISFLDCLALLQQIGSAHLELALLDKEDKSYTYQSSLIYALGFYQAASKLTQQARREISNDESKIQLAELEYYTFNQTIEIAYLIYDLTKNAEYLELAFHNSEQLKSSAIFDKISDEIAQENSLIPDSLIQKENKLNNTISIYNQKIFEENSYEDADSLLIKEYNEVIFEASRQRDELNRFLEEEYSDYYNLKYSNSMLSIENIQKDMDKDEVIIEYTIVEPEQESWGKIQIDSTSKLYTILITKDKAIFNRSIINNQMDETLENVFSFMSSPSYLFTTNDDSKEFCLASYDLFQLLIKPYEKELVNKNLTIIPDGKLNYIAFDGLILTLPDTSEIINFTKLNYLIKDFNINYANSVNILFKNRNQSQKIKNNTLAFAPEYNSEEFEISGASYSLLPLPGVQKEVDAIAETIKTKIYRKDEATEANFRTHANQFDILHLAMHAYINDSLPAFSRLAFSQNQNKELINDGWLNTTDIYNLDLNARMAVLSACNTGVGKLQKGEGMMSLARGFLFAGCPSVIISLWEVEDESGTQIMTSFYKNLKKGKSKDEALRLAKLNYLENSNSRLAHPHYWMSFKSIGDNSPIYTSYDVYFFGLLIILILAFTIDQMLRIQKIKRKRE